MVFYGLRLKYALEGSSNYISWNDHMEVVMEDNGLKEFIDNHIQKLTTIDAQNLADWNKCVARARRIILEGVRDHIVLKLHGKDTPFSMWKSLSELFGNINEAKKLELMKILRIEDKGYEVVFRDEEAYLKHLASCQNK